MAIVGALGATLLDGESAEQAVERFLSRRHLLLVVDNCEHVLGIAPFLGHVLESCPRVTVLATSREPLALQAEECRPVPPLPTDDAATLFAVRARAHDPELDLTNGNATAVADICRRVDGLPLAVELAAARCALLSPAEIARRLDAALGALGSAARDAPARHQTLRATIDWSHALLTDDEKACFASFAVFSGGATVDAAEAVTGAQLDTLDRLVAKSLLVRGRAATGETRLSMLETVRAYAAGRFDESADAAAVRERHYRHFLALAERHGGERALWGAGRREHYAALDADVENLHAALGWAVGASDAEAALALCGALCCYWLMRDRYADAVGWIERAEALPGADEHPELVLVALWAKVRAVWPLGRGDEQHALLDRAEALARSLGDPALLAQTLEVRAKHDLNAEAFARANAWADEALYWAKRSGDDWIVALAAECKAQVADTPEALRREVPRAAELLERTGNAYHLADLLASSAFAALCHGDDEHARALVARAIPLTRALDSPYVWMLLSGNAGLAALFTDHLDEAWDAFREELAVCREIVVLPFAAEGLAGLAAIETIDGDLDRAARLCGASGAHRYGQPVDPVDARLAATYFEPARERLGAGRGMRPYARVPRSAGTRRSRTGSSEPGDQRVDGRRVVLLRVALEVGDERAAPAPVHELDGDQAVHRRPDEVGVACGVGEFRLPVGDALHEHLEGLESCHPAVVGGDEVRRAALEHQPVERFVVEREPAVGQGERQELLLPVPGGGDGLEPVFEATEAVQVELFEQPLLGPEVRVDAHRRLADGL